MKRLLLIFLAGCSPQPSEYATILVSKSGQIEVLRFSDAGLCSDATETARALLPVNAVCVVSKKP